MIRRTTLLAVAEALAWWVALTGVWLVLVSAVDTLELAVGAGSAGVSALAAGAARRAVTGS
ncbi:hypothetical protein ACFV7R_26135 [Streptomyces sp. NPDC059866]|uniref:hypothetical protein n=1 Tax=Streptomyces sp. NPDC059866 TaxID=3346978 RepID=UPI003666307D